MERFVTLTFDASTGRTELDDSADPRGPVSVPEPDGLLGAWRAGWLYVATGARVRVELAR